MQRMYGTSMILKIRIPEFPKTETRRAGTGQIRNPKDEQKCMRQIDPGPRLSARPRRAGIITPATSLSEDPDLVAGESEDSDFY
jgi:hypothetical protein